MISSSKTKVLAASNDKVASGSHPTALTVRQRIVAFYQLTKPGIIYGNSLTTAAGFLYASSLVAMQLGSWVRFVATIVGTACVIASGCVLNNYLDREIDRKMKRTKARALVTGQIRVRSALYFAGLLSVIGLSLLITFTNITTVYVGLIGLYSYVIAYGVAKRRSHWGTLVGSIPGATPVVAGYTAVTGRFDLTALLLFLIMVAWQMPHFYAIAIYRLKEYSAAGIPVLPAVKGVRTTKSHIVAYAALFIVCCGLLYYFGNASKSFVVIMSAMGLIWLWKIAAGLPSTDRKRDDSWARGIFRFSLITLLVFSCLLAVNSIVP